MRVAEGEVVHENKRCPHEGESEEHEEGESEEHEEPEKGVKGHGTTSSSQPSQFSLAVIMG